ncbi:uncharacterized protein LOC136042066 [Artemia franciscana]
MVILTLAIFGIEPIWAISIRSAKNLTTIRRGEMYQNGSVEPLQLTVPFLLALPQLEMGSYRAVTAVTEKPSAGTHPTLKAKMDVFDEQIIEFVEARKYLYSSKDPGFKDRQLKQNSWESLSQSFASVGKDISVTELVKKWGNLRDRYVRLKKKGKAPSGSSADSSLKPEERKLVEKMNFLHSHIVERSRKTTGNTVQRESGITSENPLDYTTTIFADSHDSTFLQSADNQESEFSQSAETSLQNSDEEVNIDGVV